jgi:hypothetical protein
MTATRECRGCSSPLEPSKPGGRPRLWCSQRCRRQTLYGGTCAHCGSPTNGSDGPGRASDTCHVCSNRIKHEGRKWTPESVVAAIHRWADEHGGVPPVAADWNATMAAKYGRASRPDEYPSAGTVQREFGSWSAAITAAGFDAFPSGCYGRDGEYQDVTERTAELYRSGLSSIRVGEMLGISPMAVLYRVRKVGEPVRPLGRPRKAA